MSRVFRTRAFSKWLKKSDLDDVDLCSAVAEMERGLIDADLGGGVVKKRIARPGRGKSAGARTVVATRHGSHWFFVHGFDKNERENITKPELDAFRELAGKLLPMADRQIADLLTDGELTEICSDEEEKQNSGNRA